MYKYYISAEKDHNDKHIPLDNKIFYLESKCKIFYYSVAPMHIHGRPIHMYKENIETGEVLLLTSDVDKWKHDDAKGTERK